MSMIWAVITWIAFGFIAGLIARALMPGRQSMGWMPTMALGIVGSFIGGFLGYLMYGGDVIQPSSFVASVIGAIVVLAIASAMNSRSTTRI